MDEHRTRRVYGVTSCTPIMVAVPLIPSPTVGPLLLAVDFDGTITMRDTLHVIVDEHGCEGVWDDLEPDLRAGRVTIEEAMSRQFAEVKAPPEDIMVLVRERAGVRDGIRELVEFAEEEGHRVIIMSAGFRTVIDMVLDGIDLGHLEVVSNEAIFSEDGCTLVFSDDRGEICELCDRRCKRHALSVRHQGEPIVFVGDGISDRCVSGMADLVFARAHLAEWLDERGVPYEPFDDFHQVIARVREWERGERTVA
ncbi:MAG: HAD-IB family phosphatase [Actinobacteria bacterium]|nr:HAD-IB family phosphatase [Actinomycetota bacterium]